MKRPEHDPRFGFSTDIGPPATKLFGGSVATMRARDLSSFDQVYDLAEEIAGADPRRQMRVTCAELGAVARLAVQSSVIASQFARIVRLSDAGASRDALIAALREACEAARPLIGGSA